MRQKTEEEGEVSHLNDSPIMDLSEQEALGRTAIEKKYCKVAKLYGYKIWQNNFRKIIFLS